MTDKEQWFWEQCGFRIETEVKYGRPVDYWIYPHKYASDLLFGTKRVSSPPPIDFNNLKQYAFPMLDGYMMFTGEGGIHFIASKNGLNYEVVAEREEDAMFGAIYKCLGGK